MIPATATEVPGLLPPFDQGGTYAGYGAKMMASTFTPPAAVFKMSRVTPSVVTAPSAVTTPPVTPVSQPAGMMMTTTTGSSVARRCPPWMLKVLGRERFQTWRQLPQGDRRTVRNVIRREAISTFNTEMEATTGFEDFSGYGGFIYGS